jgi:hypothetical protein
MTLASETQAARERVERLLALSRSVAGPAAPGRAELCQRLVATSGLSRAGVEWALEHCLELEPSEAELCALLTSVPRAPCAHVILPAQVCVAAHRALALGLACAPRVCVRASRRDPVLLEALAAQAGGLFEPVSRLTVEPGDHVWAYGAEVTLSALRSELPRGSILHAHGDGFGVAVVDLPALTSTPGALTAAASAIARDTLAFDQRGCLSPRLVLALGNCELSQRFGEALRDALAAVAGSVPRGRLTPEELADETWYRQSIGCFSSVLDAASGTVSCWSGELGFSRGDAMPLELLLPPAGRHLLVVPVAQLEPALASIAPLVTSAGCSHVELESRVQRWLPKARVGLLGRMQTPAFDGPVDRRPDPAGERL